MSAEAPKQTGALGFLKRLFVASSELQPTYQPESKIVQLPPGLEDFATKIQQGIDKQLAVQNQQALERRNAEVNRIAAEVIRKTEAEQRQRDLLEQGRVERERSTIKATEILRDFKVSERLKYIQQTVWEGKGQIRSIEPQFSSEKNRTDMLGGLELFHHFPSVTREETGDPPWRSGRLYRWRNVPITGSMQLNIRVLRICESSGIDKKVMVVSSDLVPSLWMPIVGVIITLDANSEGLLEESFIADSLARFSSYGLPSQRERQARDMLAEAKRSMGWIKWVQESEPEAS